MPKRTAEKTKKLPPLTGIQQNVMAYVMNSIAFQDYKHCCSLDDVAEELGQRLARSISLDELFGRLLCKIPPAGW